MWRDAKGTRSLRKETRARGIVEQGVEFVIGAVEQLQRFGANLAIEPGMRRSLRVAGAEQYAYLFERRQLS
jgi:hypothetical protein